MTGPWKILMVIETSGGGSGRHVLDLAGSFSDRGHEVHILYSPRRAEPRFVSELEKIDAVKTTAVDLRRSPHYSDIQALRVIGSYLVQQGPFDVVHGHSSKGALACIAARRLRIASIFTPHAPRSLDPTTESRFGHHGSTVANRNWLKAHLMNFGERSWALIPSALLAFIHSTRMNLDCRSY